MPKPITLLSSGTRGDVQPYIALGLGLQAAGIPVQIAAPVGFADLINPTGLPFAPFDGNPSDQLIAAEQKNALTLGRNPLQSLQASLHHLSEIRPLYRQMLESAFQATHNSRAIVYGLPSLWGWHLAQAQAAQPIRALLQPLTPTRAFPSALLPFRFSLGKGWNRLTAWMVAEITWLAWRNEINHWRAQHRLVPSPFIDSSLLDSSVLSLHAFSEQIVPKPADWPASHHITGYWNLINNDYAPPAELIKFIKQASRPLMAIGFGSPGSHFAKNLAILKQALQQTGFSAVITLPAAWHDSVRASNIFPINQVPHEWLYPQMDLIIHHGGAGTTAAGLQAGVPAVILPLAIDQFFWAERLNQLGAGPQAIPQRALSVEKLSTVLSESMLNQEMKLTVNALSEKLRLEDGVKVAVSLLQESRL